VKTTGKMISTLSACVFHRTRIRTRCPAQVRARLQGESMA
jgi:hypothetical protein